MAVAEALVGRDSKPALGVVIPFNPDLRALDRLAHIAYKNGQWSLPPSYLNSARRSEFWQQGYSLVTHDAGPRILGEVVASWNYAPSAGERHIVDVLTYIEGIHPKLGQPHYSGWTPEETIVSRCVFITYDEKTGVPEVEVLDRLPKQALKSVSNFPECNRTAH